MVVRAVVAPGIIVHLTAADMDVDCDAALWIVQSSKARQYGSLVFRTKLSIKGAQQLCTTSRSCWSVCVYVLVVGVCVYVLVVGVCAYVLVVGMRVLVVGICVCVCVSGR